MTISLPSYANGDTDYVAKMNNTNDIVEQAINSLENQVIAQAGASVSVGSALPALFGSVVACIGTTSYVPTGSSTTLTVSSGYAWLPFEGIAVKKVTTTSISFAGLPSGTYYILIDSTGQPSRSDTITSYALWSVVWTGSFGDITRVAPVVWDSVDVINAQSSAAYSETYYAPDARFEASETRIIAAEDAIAALNDQATAYDITLWQEGVAAASQIMLKVKLPRAVSFPASFSGSTVAPADVPATGSTVFSIKKNGTEIGTLTYGAGSNVGTFYSVGAWSFAIGDVLTIVAPSVPDATLSGIAVCLKGTKA